MTAATILKSWLTSGEGLKMCSSLFMSETLLSSSMREWMCSFIMNVASLVKVLRAGQSWEMLFSLPRMVSSSLKLWLDVPAASSSRPVTNVCSFSWGRDQVKDTVSNLTPKTSPSLDPSRLWCRLGHRGLL